MTQELEKYVATVSEYTTGTDGCEVIHLDAKYALLGTSSTLCVFVKGGTLFHLCIWIQKRCIFDLDKIIWDLSIQNKVHYFDLKLLCEDESNGLTSNMILNIFIFKMKSRRMISGTLDVRHHYLSDSLKTAARGFAKYKLRLLEIQELRWEKEAVNIAVNYAVWVVPAN